MDKIIPHKCKVCDRLLIIFKDGSKNYQYWKGDYYCYNCPLTKRRGRK